MIPGKYSGHVTCAAAAGMGIFVAMWLLDFALIRADWCAGAQANCFREWLSALSGWAAALAAGITIFVLFDQIKEQRKQTAYAVGEAEPDFIIERNRFYNRCVVRIVNYSRHTIIVETITVLQPDELAVVGFVLDECPINGTRINMRIPGNLKPGEEPPQRSLNVVFADSKDLPSGDFTKHFSLTIQYRRIAPNQTRHSTVVDALAYEVF